MRLANYFVNEKFVSFKYLITLGKSIPTLILNLNICFHTLCYDLIQ